MVNTIDTQRGTGEREPDEGTQAVASESVDHTPGASVDQAAGRASPAGSDELPVEIGGQKGPEPTRYGDWEKNGRCTDF